MPQEKLLNKLFCESKREKPVGRPRPRWEDNIAQFRAAADPAT